ncbi:MAG: Guanylate kinase (EC [uncultured Thiotrichaceae bacterium]|uniref:Guanylate kinase n=1 Tax=uncultured Thiotrichaceae bacterium TaxID=298394 RepID=A0A6S6U2J5_9GAMM|nr:MAG: Guanylate kinase (EC [uncultured Thiotrichaceae bacterium]
MNKGTLYIVSAPSGAGKTSLLNAIVGDIENLTVSVSHTTRDSRPGEEEGVNYFFVDVASFKASIDQGDFLEYAEVFGNFYGTSQQKVEELLTNGQDVILEIDWQGAKKVREIFPKALGVFILPPSKAALQERLTNRRTDSEEVIHKRMRKACSEMQHYDEYDYLIINDNFTVAAEQLKAIFLSQRCQSFYQSQKHADLLVELISE